MLVQVLLVNKEEGLFNANCLVAHLLDAIKKKHKLSREETIDLCTTDGCVKELNQHPHVCATTFFKPRELCLVVQVDESTGHYTYTPVLPEYASNNHFVAVLNQQVATPSVKTKLKNNPPIHKLRTSEPPVHKDAKTRASRIKA